MSQFVGNKMCPGEFNNYFIGGNVCNAFAVGALGSEDDFYLVGAEPSDESSFPLLTGNILDSEGNLLCRLVRNTLSLNPGHCSKILGDLIGYEIHDSAGQFIFRVITRFDTVEGIGESYVTTLEGRFYDKTGAIVLDASSAVDPGGISVSAKCAFGFSHGSFGIVQGFQEDELEMAQIALETGGRVYLPLRGVVSDQAFSIDGRAVLEAVVSNCHIKVATGHWVMRNSAFQDCQFSFEGEAANLKSLFEQLQSASE